MYEANLRRQKDAGIHRPTKLRGYTGAALCRAIDASFKYSERRDWIKEYKAKPEIQPGSF